MCIRDRHTSVPFQSARASDLPSTVSLLRRTFRVSAIALPPDRSFGSTAIFGKAPIRSVGLEPVSYTHLGTALVQIGDPAIPALRDLLEQNGQWRAAYALNLIGSPKAKAALREHATHEPDESMVQFINKATSK